MVNFKEVSTNSYNCMLTIHHTKKGRKFKSIWLVLLINFLLSKSLNVFSSIFYVYITTSFHKKLKMTIIEGLISLFSPRIF